MLDTLTNLGIDQGILEILKAKWGKAIKKHTPKEEYISTFVKSGHEENPLYIKWVKYKNCLALQ